jgi:hypothetical protein
MAPNVYSVPVEGKKLWGFLLHYLHTLPQRQAVFSPRGMGEHPTSFSSHAPPILLPVSPWVTLALVLCLSMFYTFLH